MRAEGAQTGFQDVQNPRLVIHDEHRQFGEVFIRVAYRRLLALPRARHLSNRGDVVRFETDQQLEFPAVENVFRPQVRHQVDKVRRPHRITQFHQVLDNLFGTSEGVVIAAQAVVDLKQLAPDIKPGFPGSQPLCLAAQKHSLLKVQTVEINCRRSQHHLTGFLWLTALLIQQTQFLQSAQVAWVLFKFAFMTLNGAVELGIVKQVGHLCAGIQNPIKQSHGNLECHLGTTPGKASPRSSTD